MPTALASLHSRFLLLAVCLLFPLALHFPSPFSIFLQSLCFSGCVRHDRHRHLVGSLEWRGKGGPIEDPSHSANPSWLDAGMQESPQFPRKMPTDAVIRTESVAMAPSTKKSAAEGDPNLVPTPPGAAPTMKSYLEHSTATPKRTPSLGSIEYVPSVSTMDTSLQVLSDVVPSSLP